VAIIVAMQFSASIAKEQGRQYDFDIGEPMLGAALDALARQAGVLVLYPYDLAGSTGMNPVHGRYTLREAYETLLRGTNFSGGLTQSGVITISAQSEQHRAGKDMSSGRKGVTSVFAFIAGAFTVSPSHAQDTDAPVTQTGLEEVVVTARKRAESVQSVPVAVTAISSAVLERKSLDSLERIAEAIPDLIVGRSAHGSGASFTIRGIGAPPLTTGIEQDVATIVDGTYYGQGRIINDGLFDLAGVEILRGPQALFFGKNATAGVISINTADPGDEAEVLVRTGYEINAREVHGEGVFSTPLSDTLGLRVAVHGSNMFGGYFTNISDPAPYTSYDAANGFAPTVHARTPASSDQPGDRQLDGRITLKWMPTDRLTATLKFYRNDYENNSPNGMAVPECYPGLTHYQLDPSRACVRQSFVTSWSNAPAGIAQSMKYWGNGKLYMDYDSWGLNGTVNYEFHNITLTSITNYNANGTYQLVDDSGINPDVSQDWGGLHLSYHAFSNETRLLTHYDDPVNALIGVYYAKTGQTFNEIPLLYGAEDSAFPPNVRYSVSDHFADQAGETESVYGQLIWKAMPAVEITGGVRYSHETKDSFNSQQYVQPIFSALFVTGTQTKNQTFVNWSPEATITWTPSPGINVYAAYKTAFKAGGYSISSNLIAGATADTLSFRPETVKGYEAGIKTTLLDRQLRFNVDGYAYKYSDLQLQYFNGAALDFTTVTSDAKVRGVELETEFAPLAISGLTFEGTLNYNNAFYASFLAPCFGGEKNAEGCTLGTPVNPLQDLKGVTLPSAPLWTGSLGATYERPIGDHHIVTFSASGRYSSSYSVSALHSPVGDQGGYVNLDAMVGVRTADDRWELALIGKNLTNNWVKTSTNEIPGTGTDTGKPNGVGADAITGVNPPWTVQIQLTFRY
jgi:iron complex outermembrane recepter protein